MKKNRRAGKYPPRDPNTAEWYGEICATLAEEGCAAVYVIRRGYGMSGEEDSELLDTAAECGLEAAKDYAAAMEYWRFRDFARADKVVLMGQSQGMSGRSLQPPPIRVPPRAPS